MALRDLNYTSGTGGDAFTYITVSAVTLQGSASDAAILERETYQTLHLLTKK